MVRDAAEQVRRNAIPVNPDAYKVELPADFKLPDGIQFNFDMNDPMIPMARALAHKQGRTQEEFQAWTGLYAAMKVAERQALDQALHAEQAKLGATLQPRVSAVQTYLDGIIGQKSAAALKPWLSTAASIEAVEKLITAFTSQGAASFRQDGRVPQEGQGRVSEAEYAAMTPAQRWDYAKSFDQSQFNKSNGAAR